MDFGLLCSSEHLIQEICKLHSFQRKSCNGTGATSTNMPWSKCMPYFGCGNFMFFGVGISSVCPIYSYVSRRVLEYLRVGVFWWHFGLQLQWRSMTGKESRWIHFLFLLKFYCSISACFLFSSSVQYIFVDFIQPCFLNHTWMPKQLCLIG